MHPSGGKSFSGEEQSHVVEKDAYEPPPDRNETALRFGSLCDRLDAQATVNCFVTARATSSGGRPRNLLLDRSEGYHQVWLLDQDRGSSRGEAGFLPRLHRAKNQWRPALGSLGRRGGLDSGEPGRAVRSGYRLLHSG